MHSYYLSLIVAMLSKLGVGKHQLFNNTGLTRIDTPESWDLSATQMDTVCTNALELSTDPQLGLKLGSQINIPPQGIFGYALLTSATVGEALKLLVRHNRAILPSTHVELTHNDGRVEVLLKAGHLPYSLQHFYSEVLAPLV